MLYSIPHNLISYQYHGLAVLLLVFLFSAENLYADTTYEQKLEFAIIFEEIKGHLHASLENHETGDTFLARQHLFHPIDEYTLQIEHMRTHQITKDKTELLLSLIHNIDVNQNHEDFSKTIHVVEKVLNEIKESVLGKERDPSFDLILVTHLMESSSIEYVEGMSGSEINLMEVQDSYAFAEIAHGIFMAVDSVSESERAAVDSQFMDLFESYQQKPVSVVIEQNDQIVKSVYEILDRLIPTPDDHRELPEWIKSVIVWWGNDRIDDETFILIIESLIRQNVIHVSNNYVDDDLSFHETNIPAWFKNTAKWWAAGLVPEDDLINGISFLMSQGIIAP